MATKRQPFIPGLNARSHDAEEKTFPRGKKPPVKQVYIPGLNARPDDVEMPPLVPAKNDVEDVIDDFLSGRKNPTMCLYEYCAQKKLALQYKHEAVDYKPGMSNMGSFGFRVVIDDLAYPQGVASTKKDAKNEASKLALKVLIGQEKYVPEKIQPEIDDFRFKEVRTLSDMCGERGLLYDKMMTRNVDGQHVCTVTVAFHDPIVRKSFERDEAVVQAHADAIKAMGGSLSVIKDHEQKWPLNQEISQLKDISFKDPMAVSSQPDNHETETPDFSASFEGSRIPNPELACLRETVAYEALKHGLDSLPPEFSSYDHNVAAIFISNDKCPGYEQVGKLVAFGTGNSTIAVESLTQDGRCVIDSTCVVVARRSFKRYLAQEMLFCYNSQPSVFERRHDDPTRLQLKKGFTCHLYLSHPMDGDYKETLVTSSHFTPQELEEIELGSHYPTFMDTTHGQLRVKNERGVVEWTRQSPDQTSLSEVNLANEMRVMTASDKLQRWNILGLQGAALTHFTDPVYLSSVTLGYHPSNDYGHLSRAVCCRLYNTFAEMLPPPYVMNHPALYLIPAERREQFHLGDAISMDSLNWNLHDKKIELTDGSTGKSHKISPFKVSDKLISRQCKAGHHLKWFRDLCRPDGGHRLPVFANKSPAEVKAMATTYQVAKRAFLNQCVESDIGRWIHAPPELSMFTK